MFFSWLYYNSSKYKYYIKQLSYIQTLTRLFEHYGISLGIKWKQTFAYVRTCSLTVAILTRVNHRLGLIYVLISPLRARV